LHGIEDRSLASMQLCSGEIGLMAKLIATLRLLKKNFLLALSVIL
jgi:hypothetical protein